MHEKVLVMVDEWVCHFDGFVFEEFGDQSCETVRRTPELKLMRQRLGEKGKTYR